MVTATIKSMILDQQTR